MNLLELWNGYIILILTKFLNEKKLEGRKPNFDGFENMTNWFQERDLEEYLRNAKE
ncbi:18506_t:CDS:2 [Funneliformis geosporum]|uniref:18506_t:CDS:1 n=1 Tax=Funneliformis geosporum TaxID=1117311 RepID=A0A9W4WJ59_9GLOM|nr:18506_t:CDS:2 [Funneliformis geosporum]